MTPIINAIISKVILIIIHGQYTYGLINLYHLIQTHIMMGFVYFNMHLEGVTLSVLIQHNDKLWERQAASGSAFIFFCPACECAHQFPTKGWKFNGNMVSPTFTPSLLHPSIGCHLNLIDGIIHYCADCKHAFAGRSLPMESL